MTKRLKVGFLVDSLVVGQYVYDLIAHVAESDLFEPPVAIYGYRETRENISPVKRTSKLIRRGNLIRLPERLLFFLLGRLIRKVELRPVRNSRPEYTKKLSLDTIDGVEKLIVEGVWSKSGLFLGFKSKAISAIQSQQFDVVVRCGSGILEGEILKTPKFGVLSFHHGDNRVNRGGPSGFWEVLHSEPSSGFIIQRLNGELDGGDVLFRGNIMTLKTWTANNANLLAKSNFFMQRLLNNIATQRSLPKFEPLTLHDKPLYKLDDNALLLVKYILKILTPIFLRKAQQKLLGLRVNRWSIAYSKFDGFKKSLWRYKEIKNPKGRFLADPFVHTVRGQTVVFVEDKFYSDNRGRISAIDLTDDKEAFLGVVLDEQFHLSFPFIVEDGGTLYMVPETHQCQEIRLYECVDFPMKWQFKTTLLSAVNAVDTMIIRKNHKWFMLTNICSAGIGDYNSELHIYYSDKLDETNWRPISQGNPVIFDSRRARNGGLIFQDEKIFRINQIHGKNHYGESFGINLIKTLNEHVYEEERVDHVEPLYKTGIHSTHHFHSNHRYSVVDFCRTVSLDSQI